MKKETIDIMLITLRSATDVSSDLKPTCLVATESRIVVINSCNQLMLIIQRSHMNQIRYFYSSTTYRKNSFNQFDWSTMIL